MNIISPLHRLALVVLTLSLSQVVTAGTCDFACPNDFATETERSIDHMNESIQKGINESVRIVQPVYDAKVRSYLKTYIERYPQYTEELLARAEYYFPLFEKYLKAYGLPTDLKFLAIVESGLRAHATSPVGAAGLWQFMRGTGQDFGLRMTKYVDERRDPEKSTEAAVRYLKRLYEQFGSWELAMAGYNAGPGRVNYAMRRSGSKDFWKLQRYLPRETRGYVPGFIAANYIYYHHEQHGLKPSDLSEDITSTAVIKLYDGMSFQDINQVTGVSLSTLDFLNPMYSRKYIPGSVVGYELRLPAVALGHLIAHLDIPEEEIEKYTSAPIEIIPIEELRFEERTTFHDYRVRKGDNLYRIAQNNACSIKELMRWNGLSSSNLQIGQRLRIQVTERVAIYPEKPNRKLEEVASIASLASMNFSASFTFSPEDVHPTLKVRTTNVPSHAITIKRRMSVNDALRKLEMEGVDVSKATYSAARTGYVVHVED